MEAFKPGAGFPRSRVRRLRARGKMARRPKPRCRYRKGWIIKMHLHINRPLCWTLGSLLAACFIGLFSVYSYNMNRRTPQAAQQIVSDAPVEEEEDYRYILRSENGRLAVFITGEEQPRMEFDVPVRVLPELDQRQLEEGITVKDYPTLVSLIEDYIS